MDRGISQLENLWFLVTWNCGFKSILNTLGLNKAWQVKKLSHINEIFNTKGKAGLQTKPESQKRVDNEILESPIEALGEYITWLIYFTDGDMEAAEREVARPGTPGNWVMEHTLSSLPHGFSYLLSTQPPTFQDILIFSLIFLFQMLGDRQVTGPVADSQTLPTISLCR